MSFERPTDSFTQEALFLTRTLLEWVQESTDPFVSEAEVDYFRKLYRSLPKAPPAIAPVEKKVSLPPSLLKTPLAQETPPPPPSPSLLKTPLAQEAPPPPPIAPLPFSSLKRALQRIQPGLALFNDPPPDTLAKHLQSRWKAKSQTAPLSILSFQELPEQKALLEQIAKALEIRFGSARLVSAESLEQENQWEAFLSFSTLKWIIVCDYTLWQLTHLIPFYKEVPAQGIRTLGEVPVFLLPDLSLYLKDPLLKRSLWKALCQKISL